MSQARIAIVDDDRVFAEYLETFLRSRGYATTSYTSGRDFLKALPEAAPDAVLLDVLMPNMTGIETLRELKESNPGMPVIMISGQQVPATIVDAVRLGAIDYVVKGDDSPDLHEAALEAAIHRSIERVALTNEVARLSAQAASAPAPSRLHAPGGGINGTQPGRLPDLARAAAITAERAAIQQALDQFRWNRRKAARLLGVSYKTLLNKMKTCGISAPTSLSDAS